MCVLKMDAHLEIIYLILFLLVFKGYWSKPVCILNVDSEEQPSLQSQCNIEQITCPWDAFTLQSDTLESNLAVCLSEKAGTCMFTWAAPATESKISSPFILLSTREHDSSYGNESKQCFSISLPKHTGNLSKVTVLTELSPYGSPGSFSWIEGKVTHTNPSGNPIILSGNTVFRGEDNSCNKKDQCLLLLHAKINISQHFSGKVCRTKVEIGRMKVRFLEMRVGTNISKCSGSTRNCVLLVDKLYGRKFMLQISVILRNSQICDFSKTVLSQCWEEPLTMSTDMNIVETASTLPNPLPHVFIPFSIGIVVCLTAFIAIGVFIYRHYRRNKRRMTNKYRRNNRRMTNNHTQESRSDPNAVGYSRAESEEEYLYATYSCEIAALKLERKEC